MPKHVEQEEKQLSAVIQKLLDRRATKIRISPAWLATEAMTVLDPQKASPTEVYTAAHLQLRQLARSLLRKRCEPEDEDDSPQQHQLFPDLQTRYPAARKPGVEPEYILLEHMKEVDVLFNVRRMRRMGASLIKEADALEAWWTQQAKKAA